VAALPPYPKLSAPAARREAGAVFFGNRWQRAAFLGAPLVPNPPVAPAAGHRRRGDHKPDRRSGAVLDIGQPHVIRSAICVSAHLREQEAAIMGFGKGGLLWLIGIPLPMILLLAIFMHH
jgi:hypothetical protein